VKMSEGGYVVDHLNEFNTITYQLIFVGVNFDDDVGDLLILCSLQEIWNDLLWMQVTMSLVQTL
jgi:hypothetical protein